jgi:hypothetical protein
LQLTAAAAAAGGVAAAADRRPYSRDEVAQMMAQGQLTGEILAALMNLALSGFQLPIV